MRRPTRLRRHAPRRLLIATALLLGGSSLMASGASASAGHSLRARAQRSSSHRRCVASPVHGRRSTAPRRGRGRGRHACVDSRGSTHGRARGPLDPSGTVAALSATPVGGYAGPQVPQRPAAETSFGRGMEDQTAPPPPHNPANTLPVETGEMVRDPIDTRFLTDNPFGTTSFWLQPWRAYLDTWPASRLLESVGINFNVKAADAEPTAQLLQDSGFKLARIGTNWGAMSYQDPNQLKPLNAAGLTARLTALHNHGLRPLINVDAYSGAPAPERLVTLETTATVQAGATTVPLTPASAALVVPGKTGFNYLAFKGTPDILITSIGAGDVATLSRPLLSPLAAGPHGGATLLYSPFSAPKLASGQPNPEFQATLGGWLAYVGAVSRLAAGIVGPDGYDLEVWNELAWGSQFLNIENYYRSTTVGASAASGLAGGAAGAGETVGSAAEGDLESSDSSEAPAQAESASGSDPEAAQAGEEGVEGEGVPVEEGAAAHAASASRSRLGTTNSEIRKALLDATVAYVHDPANGFSPGVGITNGFASQSPFPSGAAAPPGLSALSKHPYAGPIEFPSEYRENGSRPRNALGELDTTSRASFTPLFTPTFQSLFPRVHAVGALGGDAGAGRRAFHHLRLQLPAWSLRRTGRGHPRAEVDHRVQPRSRQEGRGGGTGRDDAADRRRGRAVAGRPGALPLEGLATQPRRDGRQGHQPRLLLRRGTGWVQPHRRRILLGAGSSPGQLSRRSAGR
jgi:hypothetical protein